MITRKDADIREIAEHITGHPGNFPKPTIALAADWIKRAAPLGGKFAEIEAREKVATPGPWEQFSYQYGSIDNGQNPQRWVPFTADDESFVEHSRTDIPALLQEIRRLTTAREADRLEIERLNELIEYATHAECCQSHQSVCSVCKVAVIDHPPFVEVIDGLLVQHDICPDFKWISLACDCFKSKAVKSWRTRHEQDTEKLRVSEAAREQKDAEIAGLRDALAFYANPIHWKCGRCGKHDPINCYCGKYDGPLIGLEPQPWEMARAALAAVPPACTPVDTRDSRQKQVADWCAAAFGTDHAASVPQRGIRLAEESIEAAQAAGCAIWMVHKLVDHVYSKAPGNLAQEIGGVGITLLALAQAAGLRADQEERIELQRVLDKPLAHFAARNQAKNDAGFNIVPPTTEAPEGEAC